MEIKNIRVKKSEENPESAEVLAKAIIEISKAFETLLGSSLKEEAIVQLLLGMPNMQEVGKSQLKLVLANIKRLRAWYIK